MQKQYLPKLDICQGVCVLCYDSATMARKEKPFDRELFFRALADSTRLRIINLIGDQEVCVCFFVEILKPNQQNSSRHLPYLRRPATATTHEEEFGINNRFSSRKNEKRQKYLTAYPQCPV